MSYVIRLIYHSIVTSKLEVSLSEEPPEGMCSWAKNVLASRLSLTNDDLKIESVCRRSGSTTSELIDSDTYTDIHEIVFSGPKCFETQAKAVLRQFALNIEHYYKCCALSLISYIDATPYRLPGGMLNVVMLGQTPLNHLIHQIPLGMRGELAVKCGYPEYDEFIEARNALRTLKEPGTLQAHPTLIDGTSVSAEQCAYLAKEYCGIDDASLDIHIHTLSNLQAAEQARMDLIFAQELTDYDRAIIKYRTLKTAYEAAMMRYNALSEEQKAQYAQASEELVEARASELAADPISSAMFANERAVSRKRGSGSLACLPECPIQPPKPQMKKVSFLRTFLKE